MRIYTSVDGEALDINWQQQIISVPLHIEFSSSVSSASVADSTDLYFAGFGDVALPAYFVDSLAGTARQIFSGMHIRVENPLAGQRRYFIRVRDHKSPDITTDVVLPEVKSEEELLAPLSVQYISAEKGKVQVFSSHALSKVKVYDVAGREVLSVSPNAMSATLSLMQGAYVVRVETEVGNHFGKVIVK